ncbi:hypothetical protein D3C71_1545330 [compost metagenome]
MAPGCRLAWRRTARAGALVRTATAADGERGGRGRTERGCAASLPHRSGQPVPLATARPAPARRRGQRRGCGAAGDGGARWRYRTAAAGGDRGHPRRGCRAAVPPAARPCAAALRCTGRASVRAAAGADRTLRTGAGAMAGRYCGRQPPLRSGYRRGASARPCRGPASAWPGASAPGPAQWPCRDPPGSGLAARQRRRRPTAAGPVPRRGR